VSFARTG